MSTTRHPKWKKPSDADLANNPGIGTSKGTIKEGDELANDLHKLAIAK